MAGATRSLDLWPIGNCQASALIDRKGRMVWGCVPRVDGDPVFSALLDDKDWDDPQARGFWAIELEDCIAVEQSYLRNTPILVTRQADAQGAGLGIGRQQRRGRQRQRGLEKYPSARQYRPVIARIHGNDDKRESRRMICDFPRRYVRVAPCGATSETSVTPT